LFKSCILGGQDEPEIEELLKATQGGDIDFEHGQLGCSSLCYFNLVAFNQQSHVYFCTSV